MTIQTIQQLANGSPEVANILNHFDRNHDGMIAGKELDVMSLGRIELTDQNRTGATSLVASMSIAGIPPFNGFWSKLIIILAAVQAEYYGLAALAVLGSIMTLASFLKVQRYAFFGKLRPAWKKVREAPVFMCISMVLLAVLCVGMGFLLLPGVKEGLLDRATEALTEGADYTDLVLGK